ncbi:Os01g0249500 [Oryza sativa Japonica Group]|uniref:Os01g0249500 protein n=1 Tax=Oryza sativa subsp. japonica TaxID=39947 RepID=A0A0P0V0E9_ORYSJ|nr:Os01g0249500 [Oryza sativa Japonica Group]
MARRGGRELERRLTFGGVDDNARAETVTAAPRASPILDLAGPPAETSTSDQMRASPSSREQPARASRRRGQRRWWRRAAEVAAGQEVVTTRHGVDGRPLSRRARAGGTRAASVESA